MCKTCPEHSNRLSWAKINSFPIKRKDMTVEEMRALCVDFFRYTKSCIWKPSADYHYIRNAGGAEDDIFEKNTYAGHPYIGLASGSIYRLMDWYDEETGILDMEKATKNPKHFGNQCSIGSFWGWARVINSAEHRWTEGMTQANGFLRVGPYTYDDNLKNYRLEVSTKTICEQNDKQIMYQSYAKVLEADGFVQYEPGGGHVIMCTKKPKVIRTPKGNIDGALSTLEVTEQAQAWRIREDEFGDTPYYKTNIDRIVTFEQLFNASYLPFTFAEFHGGHPIEDTVCEINLKKEAVTLEELKAATVSTNYAISDVYVSAKDESGKEIYRHAERAMEASTRELMLETVEESFKGWDKKELSIEIVCQLGTGERPTIFKGKLIG